jgi:hypothetical protein
MRQVENGRRATSGFAAQAIGQPKTRELAIVVRTLC